MCAAASGRMRYNHNVTVLLLYCDVDANCNVLHVPDLYGCTRERVQYPCLVCSVQLVYHTMSVVYNTVQDPQQKTVRRPETNTPDSTVVKTDSSTYTKRTESCTCLHVWISRPTAHVHAHLLEAVSDGTRSLITCRQPLAELGHRRGRGN